MAYELWEAKGGNIIADFPTREKALEAVRRELLRGSKTDFSTWLLMYEDPEGEITDIASGAALIDLARSAPA